MKKLFLLLFIASLFSNNCHSQSHIATDLEGGSRLGAVPGQGSNRAVFVIPITHLRLKDVDRSVLEKSVELEKKKYLSYDYSSASVDQFDKEAFIRYNIFEDEMEFIKEDKIYYLAKDIGREVLFNLNKTLYRVYNHNDELQYFQVLKDGKTSLLLKQRIRHIEAKVARSGYDKERPESFRRKKDEIYLAINNSKIIKLSKKGKKDFFKSFEDKSDLVKSYAKKNKLKYKNIEDIKILVTYFNSL